MHHVLQFEFLPTEQAETYLKICVFRGYFDRL